MNRAGNKITAPIANLQKFSNKGAMSDATGFTIISMNEKAITVNTKRKIAINF